MEDISGKKIKEGDVILIPCKRSWQALGFFVGEVKNITSDQGKNDLLEVHGKPVYGGTLEIVFYKGISSVLIVNDLKDNLYKGVEYYYPDGLDTRIEDIDISVRLYQCLKKGIWRSKEHTIRSVIEKYPSASKLLEIRNLGRKTLQEFREILKLFGIREY